MLFRFNLRLVAAMALLQKTSLADVVIQNNCPFDVYSFTVWQGQDREPAPAIIASGSAYSEPYVYPAVANPVIKLSRFAQLGASAETGGQPAPITQFEYGHGGGKFLYDISQIDCGFAQCPFNNMGITAQPDNKGCARIECLSGDHKCQQVYNFYNDDKQGMTTCDDGTTGVTVELCPAGGEARMRTSRSFTA